jgi:hypothetical protein
MKRKLTKHKQQKRKQRRAAQKKSLQEQRKSSKMESPEIVPDNRPGVQEVFGTYLILRTIGEQVSSHDSVILKIFHCHVY